MVQLSVELSEWMKAKIRSNSEPYLGFITSSWAWLQIASLKATKNTMVSFWIIIYEGLQLCLFSRHAPSTKTLHRNKSKMYQNIPDGQASHVAGLTRRDRRGRVGSPPPKIQNNSSFWEVNQKRSVCHVWRRQFHVVWAACPEVHICNVGGEVADSRT